MCKFSLPNMDGFDRQYHRFKDSILEMANDSALCVNAYVSASLHNPNQVFHTHSNIYPHTSLIVVTSTDFHIVVFSQEK